MSTDNKQPQRFTALGTALAGFTHGGLVTLVGHPFDTTKVRMQSGSFRSTIDCVKSIFRGSGVRGFYKGGSMPLLSHSLKRPIQHPVSEWMKHKTGEWDLGGLSYGANYLIGLTQGPIGTIPGTPMQVVKIRMQTDTGTAAETIKTVWRENGVRGFYRGIIPTAIKDSLFGAAFIGHYYTLRDLWGTDKWYKNFINGAAAHCLCWSMLIPIDFVKTNVQKSPVPITVREVITNNYRAHGIRIFWQGVIPACLRTIPVSGVALMGYEYVRKLFS